MDTRTDRRTVSGKTVSESIESHLLLGIQVSPSKMKFLARATQNSSPLLQYCILSTHKSRISRSCCFPISVETDAEEMTKCCSSISVFLFIICLIESSTSFQRSYSAARFVTKVSKASTEDISTDSGLTSSGLESFRAPAYEIDRRRNFAIISHPDAGKTTLTEKLLLFGGAIQDAGAVKARGDQRKVTSDWMEIEKARCVRSRIVVAFPKEMMPF